ncbi:MAG: hypothetical protein Kow00109_04550 [Acidobacteriota bacterium]
MRERSIGIGVIGCGGFGLFALQHFLQVPGVRLVGMAGTHREAALAAARRFGVPDIVEPEALVHLPEVDLVYIATPPFLHYPQARLALEAGKHVLVEKPLALELPQARELVGLARERGLLCTTNLMQRYNPLVDQVAQIIEEGLLGEFLYGRLENLASDENLAPDHWFWAREKSGGIFVEHGVHFFDLFERWLGPGQVIAAARSLRPESLVEEQVQCLVRYGATGLVAMYHGFHQPGRLDRQEIRLVFERGEIRLEEWIPTRLHLLALADEGTTRRLTEILPEARMRVNVTYGPADRTCRGRFKTIDAFQMLELHAGEAQLKLHRYGDLLQAMLEDQLQWLEDRRHLRRVDEENGLRSLEYALRARELAAAEEKRE